MVHMCPKISPKLSKHTTGVKKMLEVWKKYDIQKVVFFSFKVKVKYTHKRGFLWPVTNLKSDGICDRKMSWILTMFHLCQTPPWIQNLTFNGAASSVGQHTYHDGELPTGEQRYQEGHQAGLHHQPDPLIGRVSQVGHGPADVLQNLPVVVLQEAHQGRKQLLHRRQRRTRVLVLTQVGQRPGDARLGRCIRNSVIWQHHGFITVIVVRLTDTGNTFMKRLWTERLPNGAGW